MTTMLYFVLLCMTYLIRETDSSPCQMFTKCDGTFLETSPTGSPHHRVRHHGRIDDRWPRQRHNFTVDSYDLELFFDNATHYTGSIDIMGKIVNPTSSLFVDIDFDYISYKNDVSVTCCGSEAPKSMCIQNLAKYFEQDVLEIKLSDTLAKDWECTMAINGFSSYARRDTPDGAAVGLRISGEENFTATTTNFKRSYAHTVFPCLDYPDIKANFKLCLDFPSQFTAVGGSKTIVGYPEATSAGSSRQCFERTRKLPTHMFAFALLNNYVAHTDQYNPHITIHAAISREKQVHWMRMTNWEVEFYLSETTHQKMPEELHYVVLYPGAAVVDSNFGLIFFNGSRVAETIPHISNKTFWYEAILRQFIGGRVTSAHWNEICIEEGLLMYFEMQLRQQMPSANPGLRLVRPDDFCADFEKPLAGPRVEVPEGDISCAMRAGAFFKGTAEIFGNNLPINFLAEASNSLDEESLDIDAWEKHYTDHMFGHGNYSGYLKWYFELHHSVSVDVKLKEDVFILYRHSGSHRDRAQAIPLRVFYSNAKDPVVIRFSNTVQQYDIPANAKWVFVDPDGSTCVHKNYNDWMYATLLHPNASDPHGNLSPQRKQDLVDNFCHDLMANKLIYEPSQLSQQWKDVATYAYNLNAKCKCCLKPRHQQFGCSANQQRACDQLRFVHLLSQ